MRLPLLFISVTLGEGGSFVQGAAVGAFIERVVQEGVGCS
jgi:hypothetical protein